MPRPQKSKPSLRKAPYPEAKPAIATTTSRYNLRSAVQRSPNGTAATVESQHELNAPGRQTIEVPALSAMLTTMMSDLNDDAIVEILQRMSLDELTAIATTCQRFQTLARTVFQRNFAPNCVQVESFYINKRHGRQAIAHAVRLFRTFGDLMTNISLSLFYSHLRRLNVAIFNLMVKYCTNAIDKFTFRSYSFKPRPGELSNMRPFFRHVKELHLHSCEPLTADSLSECKQLTKIRLDAGVTAYLLDNYFPKLERIELLNGAVSDSFLARHRNLIEITSRCVSLPLSTITRMHRLEQLTMTNLYDSNGVAIGKLAKLKYLRTLHLDSCVIKDNNFGLFLRQSAATATMECMHVNVDCGELDFEGIERFTNLRELKLCGAWTKSITVKDLERLEQLVQLKRLEINCDRNDIDVTPQRLVQFVQTLSNLEKLVIGKMDVSLVIKPVQH